MDSTGPILLGIGLLLLVLIPFLFDFRAIRMALRIKRGDCDGAITIAQAIPEDRRSIGVVLNHIAALYHSGRREEARDLFQIANRRQDYAAGVAQDLAVWERALYGPDSEKTAG